MRCSCTGRARHLGERRDQFAPERRFQAARRQQQVEVVYQRLRVVRQRVRANKVAIVVRLDPRPGRVGILAETFDHAPLCELGEAGQGRRRGHLELRTDQSRFGDRTGRRKIGGVEIEDRGGLERRLGETARVGQVPDVVVAVDGARIERTMKMQELDHRFAQLAEGVTCGHLCAARLAIEQNRSDHRLHVAAHVVAVVVEHGNHALDIGWGGIAGHQALDELLDDERAHVGMTEDIVHGIVHVQFRRLPRRQIREWRARVLQQLLGARVVRRRKRFGGVAGVAPLREVAGRPMTVLRAAAPGPWRHRYRPFLVGPVECPGFGHVLVRHVPAGKRLRKSLDDLLVVGRDRLSLCVLLRRAIVIEHHGADGEQLQHLAGIVLVRHLAAAAQHVEVDAHRRMQGHILQEVAEVAESVPAEHVEIAGCGRPGVLDAVIGDRDHHELQQRIRYALAQLVAAFERLFVERRSVGLPRATLHHVHSRAIIRPQLVLRDVPLGVDGVGRGRQGELLGHPGVGAHARDACDLGKACAPGRLL